jgi:protocatechuate 3,4-dioxygenase alpha subunit
MTMLKQTPSQTIGPFFHDGLILGGQNVLMNEHAKGRRITIRGTVFDGDDQPVPDAMIEIWQADAQGIYKHPADPLSIQADANFAGFGRSDTVNGGQFCFKTIKPGPVVRPDQPIQAPHINVRVFSRGLLTHAITRLYFADEPANDEDLVLSMVDPDRRSTLIAQLESGGDLPTYRFDIVLQGEGETVFFTP